MAQITVVALRALKALDHGKRLPDGGGMWGMVRAIGDAKNPVSVDFQWRYKLNGKTHDVRIGSWPKTLLAELRNERDKLRSKVKLGIDPVEENATNKLKKQADQLEAVQQQLERIEELTAQDARLTTKALFGQWLALELRSRDDKGAEAQRAFERDVFPLIGDVAANDVTKAHIQTILDNIKMRATGKQTMTRTAKRVLSELRQMFGFALERDLLDADPTARIKKAKIGPDCERDRVLSEAELCALFAKLPMSGLVETSQCALLIQLATVARIGEILGAKWENVDFQRRLWTLPKTKNGKPHTIRLSDYALRQFEQLHDLTGLTAWVFPASTLTGSLCSKTVTKQVVDRQRTDKPMSGRTKQIDALVLAGGHWTPHDLRRTGASMMAELGALPEVIEKCLNHTEENQMKRIYQRAKYEEPMRSAWQLLGERLEFLSSKHENVVTLRVA